MPMTTYQAAKVNNQMCNKASNAGVAQAYIALFTSATNSSGGGTECTDSAYARQPFTQSTTTAVTTSTAALTWAAMAANQTIVAWALMDAATGGNMLWQEQFGSSITIGAGTVFSVPSGDLTFTQTT